MRLQNESVSIQNGEARFVLIDNAGRQFPVNMGLNDFRGLAQEATLELYLYERQTRGRVPEEIPEAPHLPERIGEMAVSIGDDGEESERFDGLS